jgi:hypothetical protein
MRQLGISNIKRKEHEDVHLTFNQIIYVNGYGLWEYSVLITGCPDNIHPGTGKPKA